MLKKKYIEDKNELVIGEIMYVEPMENHLSFTTMEFTVNSNDVFGSGLGSGINSGRVYVLREENNGSQVK